ncbi:threonine synthase [soil metagenome]
MQYRSTRGGSADRSFSDVLLEGLAPDGGLFVPETIPQLARLEGGYPATTASIVRPFIEPDPIASELAELTTEVYGRFGHPDVAPLRRVSDRFVLELIWGPTLSFKDYALQLVGALFGRVMERRGDRIVILGATSGDTGAAAIEACRGLPGVDIVILFPASGVTEIQRRQMTTVADTNVHAVAVDGTFDDCQRMVKEAFTVGGVPRLAAVNSINWARIMIQAAYYAHAAGQIDGPAHFVVPTGNFGNVLSGHLARRLGVPIAGLTVANNANHGLTDLISTGRLEVSPVTSTVAPAMDIQVPSNLERYLFEVVGGDSTKIREIQAELSMSGALLLDAAVAERLRKDFSAAWRPDVDVVETIRRVHETTGVILDPHTAVAWRVADDLEIADPMVVISTAHPSKFTETVTEAIGSAPPLPAELEARLSGPEKTVGMPADMTALAELLAGLG